MDKNIYMNNKLKYPLTQNEYDNLDKVWYLISIFDIPFVFITDYRNYLVKTIRKKYTIDEFYELEMIIEKLFWNLRWVMFPLFDNPKISKEEYHKIINDNQAEIPSSLLLCSKLGYQNDEDLNTKIKNINAGDTYYRSFINKLIIIDKVNKIIYHKKMEGSSDIFGKNIFNLYTMTVLFNRKLYEKMMSDPYGEKKHKIELSNYYYQYDYGFPNLNYCVCSIGNHESRMDRIKKIYYNKSNNFEYWYKLI